MQLTVLSTNLVLGNNNLARGTIIRAIDRVIQNADGTHNLQRERRTRSSTKTLQQTERKKYKSAYDSSVVACRLNKSKDCMQKKSN